MSWSADSISFMIPNRNRPKHYLEKCLYSLSLQKRPPEEIIVTDMSTIEPYISETEKLCDEYGAKFVHTEIPLDDLDYNDYVDDMDKFRRGEVYPWNEEPNKPKPWVHTVKEERFYERYIDLFLHTFNYNVGLRNCSKELIVWLGQDTMISSNTTEVILGLYNVRTRKEQVILGRTWYLPKRKKPTFEEVRDWEVLKNFKGIWWRGGFGFVATSREWLYKVGGFEQTVRWYNDNHLLKRAKMDGKGLAYCGLNRPMVPQLKIPECSVLHISHTTKKPRNFGMNRSPETNALARRGKFLINRYVICPINQLEKDWGIYRKDIGFWHQIWKKCHARHTEEEQKWFKRKEILKKKDEKLQAKLKRV